VHFLRFELTQPMIAVLRAGAELSIGVDHDQYRHALTPVSAATRQALTADFS
jgi:hypothetical protein